MIGVIDYGAGNLRSVEAALVRLGVETCRVTGPADLSRVGVIVLPGVGRFAPAVARLWETGLFEALNTWGRSGRPLLGICLGMQLLFDGSDEDPGVAGLGLIPGRVARLDAPLSPHIGWAPVVVRPTVVSAWHAAPPRFHAYYAHSFAVRPGHPAAVALTPSPVPFTAAVESGAVRGLQFHPEKSGHEGGALLGALVRDGHGPDEARVSSTGTRSSAVAEDGWAGQPTSIERGRPHRVIPCLDIRGGRVVKGIRFKDLRDAGDPVERARAYGDDGADEVCLLDVSASQEERRPLYGLVSRVAAELRVPFTVGGGIRTLEEMRQLLLAGADRVSLGTAAVETPDLVRLASERFGRQFIIVSIDARWRGSWAEVTTHGGTRGTGLDAVQFARHVARLGAGEILLNAMDADGTRGGYDVPLTRAVARAVSVPVIASGGAGVTGDLVRALRDGGADAVLAASIFHDGDITIRAAKLALRDAGLEVRL
ncbi:MAG: imidazole glycerol phosphate synthase subunit HisF [Acidobacteriota bacterium]